MPCFLCNTFFGNKWLHNKVMFQINTLMLLASILSEVLFFLGELWISCPLPALAIASQPSTDQRWYLHSSEKRPDPLVVKFEAAKTTQSGRWAVCQTAPRSKMISLIQHTGKCHSQMYLQIAGILKFALQLEVNPALGFWPVSILDVLIYLIILSLLDFLQTRRMLNLIKQVRKISLLLIHDS